MSAGTTAGAPVSLADKVYALLSVDDTGHGPTSMASTEPAWHQSPTEFDCDLRDWGVVYGIAFGIACAESPFESHASKAARALEAAQAAWARYGSFHQRDIAATGVSTDTPAEVVGQGGKRVSAFSSDELRMIYLSAQGALDAGPLDDEIREVLLDLQRKCEVDLSGVPRYTLPAELRHWALLAAEQETVLAANTLDAHDTPWTSDPFGDHAETSDEFHRLALELDAPWSIWRLLAFAEPGEVSIVGVRDIATVKALLSRVEDAFRYWLGEEGHHAADPATLKRAAEVMEAVDVAYGAVQEL